ncbi:MAG: lysylphosphatidylglycerol synthase domain-containing protein [Rhodospirillales bacterium]
MKTGAAVAVIAGLIVLTGLVAWRGFDTVAQTMAVAGWQVLWLPAWYAVPVVLSALAWRSLFPSAEMPRVAVTAMASWIGHSVNWLLPVAQIGGEVVKARLVIKARVNSSVAMASVVVDKFVQAATQALYALIGVALLVAHGGDERVLIGTLVFVGALTLGLIGFYRVQVGRPMAFVARFAGRFAPALKGDGGNGVDEALIEIYRRRRDVLAAAAWRMAFRFAVAVEVWLALQFLGHPITLVEAIILESLGQAIRGAAFMVPGGLGIQEGGFMILGAAIGLDPSVGLSLSLCKRVRELGVGIPGLIAWQAAEGRYLVARR